MPAAAKSPTARAISRSDTIVIGMPAPDISSTASGMATRTAMPSAKVAERSQSTGCPASTLSAITGASFATTPEHRAHAARHADDERAVSDRHDHPRGRPAELLEDLAADRLVAVELRRLRAVLEERELVRRGVLARQLLRLVEVGADPVKLRPQPLEQRQLGLARLLGHEHHGPHPEPLGRPGARGAVVAGGGRDDALGAPTRKPSSAGSAPRHLNAPSSWASSRFSNSARPPSDGGASSSGVGNQASKRDTAIAAALANLGPVSATVDEQLEAASWNLEPLVEGGGPRRSRRC